MREKCLTPGCRRRGGHGGRGRGQCGLCQRCYLWRWRQITRGQATALTLVRAGLMRFGSKGRPKRAA